MGATSAKDHLTGAAVPVAAEYPPWHLLVGFGWLQWAQAAGAHLDHLVIAAAAR
jgi:hypothetical protein